MSASVVVTEKQVARVNETRLNNQGSLMKIIKYDDYHNVIIEFQDEYKAIIKSSYGNFSTGALRNPYFPSVYQKGMVGIKYEILINGKISKEYDTWHGMLRRCFDEKYKEKHPAYKDVTCCEEWLLFENFYEWLHSQDNFDKWYNSENKQWNLDKDILIKNNKIYSSDTCILVPKYVNTLFLQNTATRGAVPMGVSERNGRFRSGCMNPFTGKKECYGTYATMEEAFYQYKIHKESFIKQVAQIEFDKGNITKKCYEAMMKYKIKIND